MKPGYFGKQGWRIGLPRWLICFLGIHSWKFFGIYKHCCWCGKDKLR